MFEASNGDFQQRDSILELQKHFMDATDLLDRRQISVEALRVVRYRCLEEGD